MTLPNWAQAELIARESDDPIIALVTLTHPRWGVPQRIARDSVAVVSRGETFEAAPFDLQIASDDDGPAKASIAIPNVDRRIGEELRKVGSSPEVTIEVIALSHPDEPIYRASRMQLLDPQIGAVTVSAELRGMDFTTEPCGKRRVIPRDFPAFFR